MTRFTTTVRTFTLAGAVTLALAGSAVTALPATHAAPSASPAWSRYNAKTNTVYLTVISSYGQDTYNFNGGSKGALTVTVPLHATVQVTYSNNSMHMPHGMEVVNYTGTLPTALVPPAPAFPGAFSPNYRHGTYQGITQHFSFVASKAGTYLMICPVHNHVRFGHWDWFVVSAAAKAPSVVLK